MGETQRERTERTNRRIEEVQRKQKQQMKEKGQRKKEKAEDKRFLKMGREDFLFVLGKKDLKTAVRGLPDRRLAALEVYTERYAGSGSIGEFVHLLSQSVIVERFKDNEAKRQSVASTKHD